MQLGQAQIVRSNWYDRTLVSVNRTYSGNLAPHAITDRVDYTVPAGKIAIINFLPITITRVVAATTIQAATMQYALTISGAGEGSIAYAQHYSNVIRDPIVTPVAGAPRLLEGDRIRVRTTDLSTGGTMHMTGGFIVNEYDA